MSFSLDNNAAPVTEIEVMLKILDKLSMVLDKGSLKQTIETANGLTESVKAQAAEAKSNIATYQSLIADNNKQKDALKAYDESLKQDKEKQDAEFALAMESVQKKKSEADAILALVKTREEEIKAESTRILSEWEKQSKAELALDVKRQELEVISARIKKDEDSLATRKSEVAAYESSLKEKAEQLKKLTQGM